MSSSIRNVPAAAAVSEKSPIGASRTRNELICPRAAEAMSRKASNGPLPGTKISAHPKNRQNTTTAGTYSSESDRKMFVGMKRASTSPSPATDGGDGL